MLQSSDLTALLEQSEQAFLRELPTLLRDRQGEWVAYHGVERVAVERTKAEVYGACRRHGLRDEEFLVRCIEEPLEGEIFIGPDAASCG